MSRCRSDRPCLPVEHPRRRSRGARRRPLSRPRSGRPRRDGRAPRRGSPSAAGAECRPWRDQDRLWRRQDRTRHGEPPADPLEGLPVDDLLEGRQPAGHALGGGSDAAAPAGERLLDDERAFPRRPKRRRRQVGPDDRRLGGKRGLEIEDHIRRRRSQGDARRVSACQSASRSSVKVVDSTEMLDRLLALPAGRASRVRDRAPRWRWL